MMTAVPSHCRIHCVITNFEVEDVKKLNGLVRTPAKLWNPWNTILSKILLCVMPHQNALRRSRNHGNLVSVDYSPSCLGPSLLKTESGAERDKELITCFAVGCFNSLSGRFLTLLLDEELFTAPFPFFASFFELFFGAELGRLRTRESREESSLSIF